MRVLFVASEAVPHAKTGGLADVVGALPRYLNESGVDTTTLLPKYKGIEVPIERKITVRMNGQHQVGVGRHDGCLFVDYPEFFAREGLYGDTSGDYKDNCERFGLFCIAAMQIVEEQGYDIVHCHDWQSGMLPLYMKRSRSAAKSVFTIHNLGYQGRFKRDKLGVLGLPVSYFAPEGVEFHGDISFLKAGIVYADRITTVSENYAQEIQTPELGFGLDGVLRSRARDLHGIVNGIDYAQWNPESDDLIYAHYKDFSGKQANKTELCRDNCLDTQRPLIGMVTRIAGQKGFDILVCALDEIMKLGFNMVILGLGEESYHEKLRKLANIYHGRLSVNIKFDNRLAHRIYAGSDFFLMPSLYEPCGLGQLISLRYGTVPIVRKTGGLADTVSEFKTDDATGNGFLFTEYTGQAIVGAAERAAHVFSDAETFRRLSEGCMQYNYSWAESAKKYRQLYRSLNNP
ncbi:MAG: glycogen synthase GlgA [candidate division WOR-3 bacterium]